MFLNDRSLTNQKDGLSNQLNLTNQDFYVLEACSILDPALILTLSHLMFLKKKTQRATENYHPWAPLPAAVP